MNNHNNNNNNKRCARGMSMRHDCDIFLCSFRWSKRAKRDEMKERNFLLVFLFGIHRFWFWYKFLLLFSWTKNKKTKMKSKKWRVCQSTRKNVFIWGKYMCHFRVACYVMESRRSTNKSCTASRSSNRKCRKWRKPHYLALIEVWTTKII